MSKEWFYRNEYNERNTKMIGRKKLLAWKMSKGGKDK